MKSLLLGAAIVALSAPAAFAQPNDGADVPIREAPGRYLVFFPWDKVALTADDQRVVAQAVEEFRATGSARIDVTGFTDTSGSPSYNLRLSERRAQMVAAELERLGIPATDLVVVGRGQEELRVPTADNVREAGNRRVEIVFDAAAPPPAPPVAAAEPTHPSETVPRLGLQLAALYGHNFGESDESDSNDKTQNDLVGAELTFDALPGDIVGLSLKQAILYSFNGIDDGINGRSVLSLGLTPLNLMVFRPYLSANFGGVYGSGVQDGLVAGPELGFNIGLTDTVVLGAKVAYDYQFRNSDWDKGIFWAGLDLGYRF